MTDGEIKTPPFYKCSEYYNEKAAWKKINKEVHQMSSDTVGYKIGKFEQQDDKIILCALRYNEESELVPVVLLIGLLSEETEYQHYMFYSLQDFAFKDGSAEKTNEVTKVLAECKHLRDIDDTNCIINISGIDEEFEVVISKEQNDFLRVYLNEHSRKLEALKLLIDVKKMYENSEKPDESENNSSSAFEKIKLDIDSMKVDIKLTRTVWDKTFEKLDNELILQNSKLSKQIVLLEKAICASEDEKNSYIKRIKDNRMLGLIGSVLGDISCSRFERGNPDAHNYKTIELFNEDCEFTDDSVLSIATKYAVDNGLPFADVYAEFANKYPRARYGGKFIEWFTSDNREPYNSFGNGSAMRASHIGCYYDDIETVGAKATESAECTHNHPEGIKGAVAVAECVWMARMGCTKSQILDYVENEFEYDLSMSLGHIRKKHRFDVTCQGTLPIALTCFSYSDNYEDCIRNVISFPNCDADTIATIAGGIAAAYYGETGVDNKELLKKYLDDYLYQIMFTYDLED